MRNAKSIQAKSRSHQIAELGNDAYCVTSGGSSKQYRVTITEQGGLCTCDWAQYRKWDDQRSGCSHVVSVYNHIAQADSRKVMAWASEDDAHRQHRPTVNIGDGIWMTSRA